MGEGYTTVTEGANHTTLADAALASENVPPYNCKCASLAGVKLPVAVIGKVQHGMSSFDIVCHLCVTMCDSLEWSELQ